jgi:5-oxoprolinase (ATP-hydrolysing) subunit C
MIVIVIESIAGVATIQDLGRPGRMHEALPPGGALVPELLAIANRAAGNEDGAAAIEVFGRVRLRAETEIVVGTLRCETLRAGDELVVESGPWRVAYVALRGGIDEPIVLGGRGAHLSAGIGRRLRPKDRLVAARDVERSFEVDERAGVALESTEPIRVIAGPDRIAGGLDTLLAGEYQIAPASDRVGTRLVGPPIGIGDARPKERGTHLAVSRPMARGAIEIPPDGAPIVLGPEHPTTGGYPVIGVIAHADLGRFFARPIGARVRFAAGAVRRADP